MKVTEPQVSMLCHKLRTAQLLTTHLRDGADYTISDFREWATANLEKDTASDLIDSLIKFDSGLGDETQKPYIIGQIKHLGYEL